MKEKLSVVASIHGGSLDGCATLASRCVSGTDVTDPYLVLGVTRSASRDEIKLAYRSLSQIFHPERYEGMSSAVQDTARARMQDLNEAYRVQSAPHLDEPTPASTAWRRAGETKAGRQARQDAEDRRLVQGLDSVKGLSDLIPLLQEAEAAEVFYTNMTPVGWVGALLRCWSRLSAAGVFGAPAYDVVRYEAAWEYSKKSIYLVVEAPIARQPAWLAVGAGKYRVSEGYDNLTFFDAPMDTWVDAIGLTLIRSNSRVARFGLDKESDDDFDPNFFHDAPASPPESFNVSNRDVRKKPIGTLLFAVPTGKDPVVRNEKKWAIQGTSLGWRDSIMLTDRRTSNRETFSYDLGSSMLALARAHRRPSDET